MYFVFRFHVIEWCLQFFWQDRFLAGKYPFETIIFLGRIHYFGFDWISSRAQGLGRGGGVAVM